MSQIKILNIAPKDIYITLEISARTASAIALGLELAEVKYDGEDADQVEAQKAVTDFYNELVKAMGAVNNGP